MKKMQNSLHRLEFDERKYHLQSVSAARTNVYNVSDSFAMYDSTYMHSDRSINTYRVALYELVAS